MKTRKEPKMDIFDFGALQEKLHMLSREKYLLQKLFGAFQDTPVVKIQVKAYLGEISAKEAYFRVGFGSF